MQEESRKSEQEKAAKEDEERQKKEKEARLKARKESLINKQKPRGPSKKNCKIPNHCLSLKLRPAIKIIIAMLVQQKVIMKV